MKSSIIQKIIFLTLILASVKSNGQDLNDFKWKNRVLIVKTLKSNSKKLADQLSEFKYLNEGFKERKLILVTIAKDDFLLVDFTTNVSRSSGKVSESISKNILDQNNDFEVILIGLDGGIKLRQNQTLLKQDLFRIIDAMPMRRNEIRN